MGFNEVILADIQLEEKGVYAPIPTGTYTFQLDPGAKIRTNEKSGIESLNLSFTIAEGEFAGRKEWVSFPDPATITQKEGKNQGKPMTWSKQAQKKLSVSLGHDANPGETSVDYFNRVALTGNARVTGVIQADPYVKDGQQPGTRLSLFDFGPAA